MPKYVIVEAGVLADGKGSLAFQIAKRVPFYGGDYYSTEDVEDNGPVVFSKALERLRNLGEVS